MKFSSIRFGLPLQIFTAITLGCIFGFYFGPAISPIGIMGTWIIKILKSLATPLVFLAISDALFTAEIPLQQGVRLIGFSLRNAFVALLISIIFIRAFPVNRYLDLSQFSALIFSNTQRDVSRPIFQSVFPTGLEDFVSGNNIISVICVALAFGLIFRKNIQIKTKIKTLLEWNLKALKFMVLLVPIAAFSVIAKIVGTSGFKFFSTLAFFVFLVAAGLMVHVFVYYSVLITAYLKISPVNFFKKASAPLLTAFGTGSSLASLPVTLPILQEKMGVSEASSRLAACVGTNLNHDGIILYEATAALFIAQIQGVNLNFAQQIQICLTSVLAAIGIAGVPEAGLITLSLVLGSAGLSVSAVSLLLPVDWFLGRLRAATNVASDIVVAHLLDC